MKPEICKICGAAINDFFLFDFMDGYEACNCMSCHAAMDSVHLPHKMNVPYVIITWGTLNSLEEWNPCVGRV